MSWPLAGQQDLDDLYGPFHPNQFYDSMISVRWDITRAVCSLKLTHFLEKLFSSVLFYIILSLMPILVGFSAAQADIKLKRSRCAWRSAFGSVCGLATHSLARLN